MIFAMAFGKVFKKRATNNCWLLTAAFLIRRSRQPSLDDQTNGATWKQRERPASSPSSSQEFDTGPSEPNLELRLGVRSRAR